MLGQYFGNETRDPAKAAQVVLKLAYREAPAVRLPLGSDALHNSGEADTACAASGAAWRQVSLATERGAPASLPAFPQS